MGSGRQGRVSKLLPVLLTFAGILPAAEPFTVYSELTYSHSGMTLDLFIPHEAAAPVPCVMVIQGGGFSAQDGQRFRPFAEFLARHGFAAALIAYRGRPDHEYRDTLADVKASVRFIRKVAGEYGIDPERIGAMGRSAGGTLTALLAVTGGMEAFEGNEGHAGYSSRIQAAVAYAGVFDFVARFTDPRHIGLQPKVKAKMKSNGAWIGPEFSPDNADWLRASAINHVDPDDPPMLLLQCKNDSTVPWLQSQEMFEALRAAGTPAEIHYYETGGHGFNGLGEEPMAAMVRYFKRVL